MLCRFAGKYIWWKSAEEASAYPGRVAAQVMNLGVWEDTQELVAAHGEEGARRILRHSEAGWFTERSWNYWHYRLGLASADVSPPPMPARRFE
jgi:hypothetical protein